MLLVDIEEKISRVLRKKFNLTGKFPKVVLTPAPKHTGADLSCSWAMQAAGILKKSPAETAKSVLKDLEEINQLHTVDTTAGGFINIKLTDSFILHNLHKIVSELDTYNKPPLLPKEKILIEFVSANPTGPLHIASGRGAGLGDCLVKIFRELGYGVSSEYYINDAGNQAYLLGLSLKARHKNTPLPENGYKGEYLADLARKIPKNAKFSDKQYSDFAIKEILKSHKRDMDSFNVNFDNWFKESTLQKDDSISKTLKYLKSSGKAYEKDGAVWFGLQTDKDAKERVLVRKDKRPTYFLSDLAYHKNKYERGFDTLIDVWGADHYGYISRMKEGIAALGFRPDSFKVLLHQFVHIKKGKQAVQMSKRTGKFKMLSELMEEAGTDACRFFFALVSPNSHLTFDTELAKKKTKENPVYYVQYVYARISSIFKTAEEKNIVLETMQDFKDISLCKTEKDILKKLLWFNPTLKNCIKDLSPHHLANYLLELAGLFHPFYDNCKVLDSDNLKTTQFRLMLCAGVRVVIAKGLNILGVSAPKTM